MGRVVWKKKKKAQKPVNVRSLTLIKFSFLARPQKKKSQFLFWVKCEWKKESVNWKVMKDLPLSSSSADEEGKKRGFWKPGESLNRNCNLPFERGEIFFTTNYLPKSLSHRLRSAPSLYLTVQKPHECWEGQAPVVLVDSVMFCNVSIRSVHDDAPSKCPRHHVRTSSWTRIFSFRFEILNLNIKRSQHQQVFFLI